MKTTLRAILAHEPSDFMWTELLSYLGKTGADDDPLLIETILDSNGILDTLWSLRAVEGHDREMRLYAIWCARQVQNLMTDPRSISALDVAERFARGRATYQELSAAWSAADAAADDAVLSEKVVAIDAARAAAATAMLQGGTAAAGVAGAAASAWGSAWAAAVTAPAWAAEKAVVTAAWRSTVEVDARSVMRILQQSELRRVCCAIEAGRDPYPEGGK